jgi:hypothetical protein
MDKQLFDDAIGEVPPSTVDVDAVIRRGRRAVLVRRVANPAVAAGVAVLLLIGVVAYTMTRDDDVNPIGTPPSGQHRPPATTTESPSSTVPDLGAPIPGKPAVCDDPGRVEETQRAIDRLDAAVEPLVVAHAQLLQLDPSPGAFIDGIQHGALDFFQVDGHSSEQVPLCDGDYLLARAVATASDGGKGNLMVLLGPAQYESVGGCGPPEVTPSQTECQELTPGPGISAMTSTHVNENGVVKYRVDMLKPDGTSLVIEAENSATTSKIANGPSASVPPLTKEALLQLALEPQLVLFPNA